MTATLTAIEPLVEQLMQTEGKAEIVNGEIKKLPLSGFKPGFAGDEIYASLRDYVRAGNQGVAVGDNKGFLCELPNRRSFSPDAALYVGELPDMGFFPSPPIFAVEVRSENDYGRRAEREIAQKRADYFAAGTQVVWDVDLRDEEVIAKYSAQDPQNPEIFRRGEVANAEPAVAGWTIAVDDLFPATATV